MKPLSSTGRLREFLCNPNVCKPCLLVFKIPCEFKIDKLDYIKVIEILHDKKVNSKSK